MLTLASIQDWEQGRYTCNSTQHQGTTLEELPTHHIQQSQTRWVGYHLHKSHQEEVQINIAGQVSRFKVQAVVCDAGGEP